MKVDYKLIRDLVWYEDKVEGWSLEEKSKKKLEYKQYYKVNFVLKKEGKFWQGSFQVYGNHSFEGEWEYADTKTFDLIQVRKIERVVFQWESIDVNNI